MNNHKPVIIGSAEARDLIRRIERIEKQVEALISAAEASKGLGAAIQTLCDMVDGHEARLNAMTLMQPVAVERKGKVNG